MECCIVFVCVVGKVRYVVVSFMVTGSRTSPCEGEIFAQAMNIPVDEVDREIKKMNCSHPFGDTTVLTALVP